MNKKIIVAAGIAAIAAVAGIVCVWRAHCTTADKCYSAYGIRSQVKVVTSFYPVNDFTRVGGDKAEVSAMIPVGVEPHDWEPTVQNIIAAQQPDMFVINGAGFEGGWINDIETKFIVDTSLRLNRRFNNDKAATKTTAHQRQKKNILFAFAASQWLTYSREDGKFLDFSMTRCSSMVLRIISEYGYLSTFFTDIEPINNSYLSVTI